MFLRARTAAMAAVLVGVIALTLSASGAAANADSNARPLKGTFDGGGLNFSGQLTHLGTYNGNITFFQPTGPGTFNISETWTAANGDQVFSTAQGTVTGVDPITGFQTFSEVITINGGTGRFADATGVATGTGEIAAGFTLYYGQYSGTIGY